MFINRILRCLAHLDTAATCFLIPWEIYRIVQFHILISSRSVLTTTLLFFGRSALWLGLRGRMKHFIDDRLRKVLILQILQVHEAARSTVGVAVERMFASVFVKSNCVCVCYTLLLDIYWREILIVFCASWILHHQVVETVTQILIYFIEFDDRIRYSLMLSFHHRFLKLIGPTFTLT